MIQDPMMAKLTRKDRPFLDWWDSGQVPQCTSRFLERRPLHFTSINSKLIRWRYTVWILYRVNDSCCSMFFFGSKLQYHVFLPSATVVAERLCFTGVCLSTGGRCTPPGQTPPRRPLQRKVRILLECILVLKLSFPSIGRNIKLLFILCCNLTKRFTFFPA